MNPDDILEQIKSLKHELAELVKEIDVDKVKKDKKIETLKLKLKEAVRIYREMYKKRVEELRRNV